MSSGLRHQTVRRTLASQIESGELKPGERLPSERDLQAEFRCSRSVVRQALGSLTRDGWIEPVYPKGYLVVGPRIPWISRLEPLRAVEGWSVEIVSVDEQSASDEIAEALGIEAGATVIRRQSILRSAKRGETWGVGEVFYPEGELTDEGKAVLLREGELTYEALESAFRRRIIGFREQIKARMANDKEARALGIDPGAVVWDIRRIARTSTNKPISVFHFIGRADRFEMSYLAPND